MFQQCLELPSQSRHSIAFPLLCTHFMSCTHELCPEEVRGLGDPAGESGTRALSPYCLSLLYCFAWWSYGPLTAPRLCSCIYTWLVYVS